LILNTENNPNEEGETNASALPHGKFVSWKIIKTMNCCLDDTIDEREEDQANAEEETGGEQWFSLRNILFASKLSSCTCLCLHFHFIVENKI
jgi:hypothetical protein